MKDFKLIGKSFLITRPFEQANSLANLLEKHGGNVVICPTIKIVTTEDEKRFRKELASISNYNWIIFTSVNGVQAFYNILKKYFEPTVFIEKMYQSIAAIGPATATAAEKLGFTVSLVPSEYVAEGVIKALKEEINNFTGLRFLLPRADKARKTLSEELKSLGAVVTDLAAYKTVSISNFSNDCKKAILNGEVDCYIFTSPSTVNNFFKIIEKQNLLLDKEKLFTASIGPITSKALIKNGIKPKIQAKDYTIPGLVKAIISWFEENYLDLN